MGYSAWYHGDPKCCGEPFIRLQAQIADPIGHIALTGIAAEALAVVVFAFPFALARTGTIAVAVVSARCSSSGLDFFVILL